MKKLFSNKGRISRFQFFSHVVFTTILMVIILSLMYVSLYYFREFKLFKIFIGSIFYISSLLYLLNLIKSSILRFHDLDISGLHFFYLLMPVVNIIWLLRIFLHKGSDNSNTYGGNPIGSGEFEIYDDIWKSVKNKVEIRNIFALIGLGGMIITAIIYFNFISNIPEEFRKNIEFKFDKIEFFKCITNLKGIEDIKRYYIEVADESNNELILLKKHNHQIMFQINKPENFDKLTKILALKKFTEQKKLYFHNALIYKEFQIKDKNIYIQTGEVEKEIYNLLKLILINVFDVPSLDKLKIAYKNNN